MRRAAAAALALAAGPLAAGSAGPAAAAPFAPPLRVEVAADGPVAVFGRDLEAAGWTGVLDVRRLRLTRGGRPVALDVRRAAGGSAQAPLGPDDALRFVGRAMDTPYARARPYRLAYGPPDGPGPAWGARDAAPAAGAPRAAAVAAEIVLEEDSVYLADIRPGGGDRWVWDRALGPGEARDVVLDVGPSEPEPARLTVLLQGATDDPARAPDHRARLRLGETLLAEATFDGFGGAALVAWLPAGALVAAQAPVLRLESVPGPAGVDGWHLDRVDVAFQRRLEASGGRLAFVRPAGHADRPITYRLSGFGGARPPEVTVVDATDPDRPVRLAGLASVQDEAAWAAELTDRAPAGARYLAWAEPAAGQAGGGAWPAAPAAVRQEDERPLPAAGDWLAIAGDGLADALGPLAAARARQGLRPAVVAARDVYRAFGEGAPDPEAIRRFVGHALATWRPPPRYVLLVGEANLDHRGGYARARGAPGPPDLLPTLQVELADGTAATSDWPLADADGDGAPDVAIGRLPGASADEVGRVVGRLAAAARAPSGGAPARVVLVTDGARPGAFATAAEGWAAAAAPVAPEAVRLYGAAAGQPAALPAAVRAALAAGARIVGYVGHGNVDTWASWPGPGGRLLGAADVAALPAPSPAAGGVGAGSGGLGLLVSATCLNAWFDHPVKAVSLAEAWLLAPGGGTAAFAPTGYARLEGQAELVRRVLERIGRGAPGEPLGDALLDVLRAADGGRFGPEVADAARAFALLGDPAAPLAPRAGPGDPARTWLPVLRR